MWDINQLYRGSGGKYMWKWKIKLVLLLTTLGAIGIIAIIPYGITTLMDN